MKVQVCVGSSCHLKGSYNIIELMTKNINEYNLTDNVSLNAAFCLGKCTDGVTIQVNDEIICGVSTDNFDDIFNTYVLKK